MTADDQIWRLQSRRGGNYCTLAKVGSAKIKFEEVDCNLIERTQMGICLVLGSSDVNSEYIYIYNLRTDRFPATLIGYMFTNV